MRSRIVGVCAVLLMGLVGSSVMVAAQEAEPLDTTNATPRLVDTEPAVARYDLSGPRIGATLLPDGLGVRSQFGWHFENQASPGQSGPRFLVERVFLVGGVERSEFMLSGTLVFGIRTPGNFEVGIGPSATLGTPYGASTAVVFAVGQTLDYGGIHVPVNVAVAMNQDTYRVSLITGWAIRDVVSKGTSRPRRETWRDRDGFHGAPGD